jgi:hypothetical protein
MTWSSVMEAGKVRMFSNLVVATPWDACNIMNQPLLAYLWVASTPLI